MSVISVTPLSLHFQSCQIGLNFASEEEAKRFRVAISDLLNRRQRKTGEFQFNKTLPLVCFLTYLRRD